MKDTSTKQKVTLLREYGLKKDARQIRASRNPVTAELFVTLLFAALTVFNLLSTSYAQGTGQDLPSIESNLVERFNLNPGEEVAGTLVLIGTGEREQTLSIRVRDLIELASEKHYEGLGAFARSNATWVNGLPSQIRLAPGEKISLPYRLLMPNTQGTANQAGTYYSVILIEPITQDPFLNPENSGKKAEGMNFVLEQRLRYGIQLISDTTQVGTIALDFAEPKLIENEQGVGLQAILEHRGSQGIGVNLTLELYDTQGELVASLVQDTARYFYPQSSQYIYFDLGNLAPGTYDTILIADAGQDNIFGVRYSLEVE